MFKSKEIYKLILLTQDKFGKKGTFFSAVNITRKGERKWSCRLDVTKHLRGGELGYDPSEKNTITVWDINAKGSTKYRQLKVDTLQYLRVSGEELIVNAKPTELYNELMQKV